jgi:hypothetical protein
MENQLHRRVREGEENDYEKGYHNNPVDAENSYPRNYKKNDTNKNVLFILFILLITIMAAGVYIDLKKMDNKKVSHSRKLTNHDVCIRTNYDTLTDYMKCITDSNKIVIISDKSEESIMTDFLYKDYDMGYRHLRDIFHDVNDLFTFYEVFQNRSPWIFIDGAYLGNEKDLNEYYIYHLINDESQISPSLNEVERKYIKSDSYDKLDNMDGMDELKIRKYLRRYNLKDTYPAQKMMEHIIDELEMVQEMMNKNQTSSK